MPVSDIGDPRLQELFGADAAGADGVRPLVRLPRGGPSGWTIAAFAVLAALILFWVLESRREAQPAPDVRARPDTNLFSPEPPPLYIPPAPPPQIETDTAPAPVEVPAAVPEPEPRSLPAPPPQIVYRQSAPQPVLAPPQPARTSAGPALVIDTTAPAAPAKGGAAAIAGIAAQSPWGGRARASTLANRSNTVAQGALIPAVLETGFNSTSPGLARAIVSRDVRGFDGTKVLIPRGSRLIGEYRSSVSPGQNRALITWTRLIRPDGVTIALDSPATDTLGRGGIRASVNSHFWTRLGDALLGSTLDVGAGIAARAATGSLIVAVPGAVQQSADPVQSNRIAPTLSIKPGTSISVFVARDLEFPNRAGVQ
ncbi:MAG TPA: TrbI/VirB10 family protein [Sphingomicrobium sp.]|jgi:type IV secretion system protein VirB10|nr:TrbI/VirB10 family protein [Sphingomicrobium sp.]